MSLDESLRRRLERRLTVAQGTAAHPRLPDDARRLCRRALAFAASKWAPRPVDSEAIELACWALQLPLSARQSRAATGAVGASRGRFTLRDQADQAAELLAGAMSGDESRQSPPPRSRQARASP